MTEVDKNNYSVQTEIASRRSEKSSNSCEDCSRNCCQDFKITTEITDPLKLREILTQYPFIRRTGFDVVLLGHREVVVSTYNCDRFQKDSRRCKDYETQPRPDFCYNTGIKIAPHAACLLKK